MGEGPAAEDLACNSGTLFRASADRFSIALPLSCLDKPKDDLKARMILVNDKGVTEQTELSKSMEAPE